MCIRPWRDDPVRHVCVPAAAAAALHPGHVHLQGQARLLHRLHRGGEAGAVTLPPQDKAVMVPAGVPERLQHDQGPGEVAVTPPAAVTVAPETAVSVPAPAVLVAPVPARGGGPAPLLPRPAGLLEGPLRG